MASTTVLVEAHRASCRAAGRQVKYVSEADAPALARAQRAVFESVLSREVNTRLADLRNALKEHAAKRKREAGPSARARASAIRQKVDASGRTFQRRSAETLTDARTLALAGLFQDATDRAKVRADQVRRAKNAAAAASAEAFKAQHCGKTPLKKLPPAKKTARLMLNAAAAAAAAASTLDQLVNGGHARPVPAVLGAPAGGRGARATKRTREGKTKSGSRSSKRTRSKK